MTSSKGVYSGPARVGTIRPSQAIHSYGVGALIDLPNLSVIVGGLDRWDATRQAVVTEERLLAAVQATCHPVKTQKFVRRVFTVEVESPVFAEERITGGLLWREGIPSRFSVTGRTASVEGVVEAIGTFRCATVGRSFPITTRGCS